jgi:hypothetical protein
MIRRTRVFITVCAAVGALTSLDGNAQNAAAVSRTIYVSATNEFGAPVTNLTAADFTVKEGGRERPIELERSREHLIAAVVIDELLAGDNAVRHGLLVFLQRLQETAHVALYLAGRRTELRVNYTGDFGRHLAGVNALPRRPQYPGRMVEAIFEVAEAQKTIEGRRVIVAIAPTIPETRTVTAEGVLERLRDSGAVMHAATVSIQTTVARFEENPASRLENGDLTDEIERDRLLGEGPKQSGGLRITSPGLDVLPAALEKILGALRNEYIVSYELPPGTKSDGRISIAAKRKGLKLHAPTRLPKP